MFDYSDDEIEAIVAEMRATLEPEKFDQFEAVVREAQELARTDGAEGDHARLRLGMLVHMGTLTYEQLAELSWVIGGVVERRVLLFPGRKEPPER